MALAHVANARTLLNGRIFTSLDLTGKMSQSHYRRAQRPFERLRKQEMTPTKEMNNVDFEHESEMTAATYPAVFEVRKRMRIHCVMSKEDHAD